MLVRPIIVMSTASQPTHLLYIMWDCPYCTVAVAILQNEEADGITEASSSPLSLTGWPGLALFNGRVLQVHGPGVLR